MSGRERSQFEISRLDRAGTLLLASLALAVIAFLGWSGPIFDLHLPSDLAARALAAIRDGIPAGPVILRLIRDLQPADLAPLIGTAVTVLLIWHLLSLVAEFTLVLADTLGWLGTRWLWPLWRFLDLLDSGPLARPKRFVIASALVGQLMVQTGLSAHAAAMEPPRPAIVVEHDGVSAIHSPIVAESDSEETAPYTPWLMHHVRRGETLSGLAFRYYGDAGHWVTLFRGNAGTVMGWGDGGRGAPVRLTNPDYILEGCDLAVIPVAGRLEQGSNGEIIYVVQSGDTLSGIASRFDISLDDLWAANQGMQAPDGQVVENPDLIWAGVRVQVSPLVTAATEPEPDVATEPQAQERPSPTIEASPTSETGPTVAAAPVEPTPSPIEPVLAIQPSASPTPTIAAPTRITVPTAPPVAVPVERSPDSRPPLWPVAPVVALSALGLGAFMVRRRRRPFETDLTFDRGRVNANPAQSLRTHIAGDPAELAAAGLLRLAASHGIADAQIVVVFRDPAEITVVLNAPVADRDRLRLLLPAAAALLARRVTVWATADHDVAVRLEDLCPAELVASDHELPLLVSIGGLGDGRELLADWQALGHLLIVSQPGTDDACVQLAATVTMLAACQPVDRITFYTCASAESALAPLKALPHQQVMAHTPETTREMLAALESLLDHPAEQGVERVLIVGELGDLDEQERMRLERLLAMGSAHGVRVLSASTDLAVAGELAARYPSRVAYALGDEDDSVRVLGSTDAASLPSDGSMLVRLGGRTQLIEAYQLRVLDEDLAALVETMRAGHSRAAERQGSEQPDPSRDDDLHDAARTSENRSAHLGSEPVSACEAAAADPEVSRADSRPEHLVSPGPSADHGAHGTTDDLTEAATAVSAERAPVHIRALLNRAEPHQPVLQCLGGLAVWCRDSAGQIHLIGPGTGPGQIGLTRQFELLTYVAVRTAVHGPADQHGRTAAPEIEVRSELWGDAASRQIVGITARRLMADLKKVGLEPRLPLLRVEHGRVTLDEAGCLVDVHAFEQAVSTARRLSGPAGLTAAEAAVAAYGGRLLAGLRPDEEEDGGSSTGARGGRPPRAPVLGWTQELAALSVAGTLEALYREALGLLAARLKDAGRIEETLDRTWEALHVGEFVRPNEVERLVLVAAEVAVALKDESRARGELQRLADYLESAGLDMPTHLQERLRPIETARILVEAQQRRP